MHLELSAVGLQVFPPRGTALAHQTWSPGRQENSGQVLHHIHSL